MKLTVSYVFDEGDVDEGSPLAEVGGVRLTVQTVNMRRMGEHAERMREAREALARVAGIEVDALAQHAFNESERAMFTAFKSWARIIISTVRVQVCKKDQQADTILDVVWEESSLKAVGLDVPEGVLDLPVPLFDSWIGVSEEVNKGIFNYSDTVAEKKRGMISVT